MLRKTIAIIAALLVGAEAWPASAQSREQVQRLRSEFIVTHIGPLATRLRELESVGTLWPGGGLYAVEARHLGADTWAYLTFGLTNPDLPTASLAVKVDSVDETGGGIVHDLRQRLSGLAPPSTAAAKKAGYGYELMVLTRGAADWPYALLEWIVNQEILGDRDFITQVEAKGGLTLKDIRISDSDYASVLITKARDLLPSTLSLPNGEMHWLAAIVLTDDELVWAEKNGADALLQKLVHKGIGHSSDLDRASVIHPQPIDYKKISSRKEALKLYEKGLLRKVYLFPPEFGGDEEDLNAVYLPRKAAIEKKIIDERVLRLARQGKITNYGAAPQYLGASFIPAAIEIRALGEAGFETLIKSWEEKPFQVPSTTEIYRKIREQGTENR